MNLNELGKRPLGDTEQELLDNALGHLPSRQKEHVERVVREGVSIIAWHLDDLSPTGVP